MHVWLRLSPYLCMDPIQCSMAAGCQPTASPTLLPLAMDLSFLMFLACLHRYLGVGSSNRKNQWQARILYHGKVTHLGYYRTEEEAARVYDKVSISLHGAGAQTNFPIDQVTHWLCHTSMLPMVEDLAIQLQSSTAVGSSMMPSMRYAFQQTQTQAGHKCSTERGSLLWRASS